jgi:hypothetical protein
MHKQQLHDGWKHLRSEVEAVSLRLAKRSYQRKSRTRKGPASKHAQHLTSTHARYLKHLIRICSRLGDW